MAGDNSLEKMIIPIYQHNDEIGHGSNKKWLRSV